MGSAIKSAGNAVADAAKKTYKTADAIVTGTGRTANAVAKDPGSLAAILVNPTMAGSTVAGTKAASSVGTQVMAANTENPGDSAVPVVDQSVTASDPLDPATAKRRMQLAGRAGTILTGGDAGGGTNLGASGSRSTLLGL